MNKDQMPIYADIEKVANDNIIAFTHIDTYPVILTLKKLTYLIFLHRSTILDSSGRIVSPILAIYLNVKYSTTSHSPEKNKTKKNSY